jgi:hypothetical protein
VTGASRASGKKNNALFVSGSEESGVIHGKINLPKHAVEQACRIGAAGLEGRGRTGGQTTWRILVALHGKIGIASVEND